MTEIQERLSQAATNVDAFSILTEVEAPLMVLYMEAGSTTGEIWINEDRKLFFAKANGDGGNGLMALMMLLAAKGAKFKVDCEQPVARKQNIDTPIYLRELVANQAGTAEKIKNILWPVTEVESEIATDTTTRALPPELLEAAIFGTTSGSFFGGKSDEDEEPEAAAATTPAPEPEAVATPEPEPVVASEPEPPADADIPQLISMEELEGYSLLGDFKPDDAPAAAPQPQTDFAPEPTPVVQSQFEPEMSFQPEVSAEPEQSPESDAHPEPEPFMAFVPEPAEPVIEQEPEHEPEPELELEQPEPQLEAPKPALEQPEAPLAAPEPVIHARSPFSLAEPMPAYNPEPAPLPESFSEPVPIIESISTPESQPSFLGGNAEAEKLPAPVAEPPAPPAPPLAQSGRFQAPSEQAARAASKKRISVSAITTTAAALAILSAVGFTIYSGITSGAQAARDDKAAASQFVTDTIDLKAPPKLSE
jgi:hypothetical protein